MTEPSATQDGPKRKRERQPSNALVAKLYRRIKKHPVGAFFLDIFVIVASALVLSVLIKTFLIRSFYIPSGSMENTLQINDRIIVNELVPNLVPLQRGDVVVFKDPGGWLPSVQPSKTTNGIIAFGEWFLSLVGLSAPDSEQHLVKRVIGVGGDHIVCTSKDSNIQINGVTIEEPYLAEGGFGCSRGTQDPVFDVTVPENMYWVMGDNRNNSEDSRAHEDQPGKGFVAKSSVVGRAFVLSWPFSRFTWLDNYPNVFKDLPNK